MRRTGVVGVLVVVLAVLAAGQAALASPQPVNVCGACGAPFEDVASEQGIPVNVTASTVTLYAHGNGSVTWVVTNRINRSAAAEFADTPDALERVSRAAATDGRGLPSTYGETSVEFLSASIEKRNVTLRFRQTGATERHLGLTVVDTFHSDGVRGGWIVNADQSPSSGRPGPNFATTRTPR